MTVPLLDDQLRALSVALEGSGPPASVDRAIAAAVAKQPRGEGKRGEGRFVERWLAWPVALAASIFAISIIVRQAPPQDVLPALSADAMREGAQSFTPVASAEEISRAGDTFLMPARLPRVTLAQLGFPVDPERIGEAVETELLVRGDGMVLALRFVY